VPDVPAEPLSQYLGELPVPSGSKQGVERVAASAAGTRHEQRAEAFPELASGTGHLGLHAETRDSQRGGGLPGAQTLPDRQQHYVSFALAETAERGTQQRVQLRGLFWWHADGGAGLAALDQAQALNTRHGEQPGPQVFGFAQVSKPGSRYAERVTDHPGGVVPLAELGAAVSEQGRGIPVKGRSESRRLTGHDRRDDVAIPHGSNLPIIACTKPIFRYVSPHELLEEKAGLPVSMWGVSAPANQPRRLRPVPAVFAHGTRVYAHRKRGCPDRDHVWAGRGKLKMT
jgi:hypothetical protein